MFLNHLTVCFCDHQPFVFLFSSVWGAEQNKNTSRKQRYLFSIFNYLSLLTCIVVEKWKSFLFKNANTLPAFCFIFFFYEGNTSLKQCSKLISYFLKTKFILVLTLLFKKVSKDDPENFRPISLLPKLSFFSFYFISFYNI